jgi:hypothetical protein
VSALSGVLSVAALCHRCIGASRCHLLHWGDGAAPDGVPAHSAPAANAPSPATARAHPGPVQFERDPPRTPTRMDTAHLTRQRIHFGRHPGRARARAARRLLQRIDTASGILGLPHVNRFPRHSVLDRHRGHRRPVQHFQHGAIPLLYQPLSTTATLDHGPPQHPARRASIKPSDRICQGCPEAQASTIFNGVLRLRHQASSARLWGFGRSPLCLLLVLRTDPQLRGEVTDRHVKWLVEHCGRYRFGPFAEGIAGVTLELFP